MIAMMKKQMRISMINFRLELILSTLSLLFVIVFTVITHCGFI